jgi:CspA family cold shock protein
MKGHVKWWKADRGYGFLTGEDAKDYFVHFSDILGEGHRDLEPFAAVEFESEKNVRGHKAVRVKMLPTP